jgi:hypothetical protein
MTDCLNDPNSSKKESRFSYSPPEWFCSDIVVYAHLSAECRCGFDVVVPDLLVSLMFAQCTLHIPSVFVVMLFHADPSLLEGTPVEAVAMKPDPGKMR